MKNTKINKMIANFLMAIILITGLSTISFAKNVETSNITSITESNNRYFTIGRYRSVFHRTYLYTGDYADITLSGDGTTNLDLYVYDGNGNLIDYRAGRSDYEVVSIEVYRGGTFQIKVVNRGRTYNNYTLDVVRY